MATETKAPEQRTIDVDVEDVDTRGRTLHGYAAVYGATSGDLGGFREQIAPGAFEAVIGADVRCLLNHDPSQVLGRTKSGTLRLADEQRGLRFECDLPDSPLGENVRSAVSRGDIDGASFRFEVGTENWDGDLRTIRSVKALHDVTVATYGAYPDASVELRTRQATTSTTTQEDKKMSEESTPSEPAEEASAEDKSEKRQDPAAKVRDPEVKVVNEPAPVLQVEDRAGPEQFQSLTEAYRQRGFPGETASLSWGEFRSATFGGGTVVDMNPVRAEGVPLGADQRYAYPAFPQVAVDSQVTSVQVLQQTSRTLPAGTAIIRDIDAVTAKPEVTTATALATVELSQVAAVETDIPNVIVVQDAIGPLIETDLRLAVNEGLDQLVVAAVANSGFEAPGSNPLLVSIRRAAGTIEDSGYGPDTVILRPSDAMALDTLTSTGVAGTATQDYIFAPELAPRSLFGLNVRISSSVAAPVVCDASAFGKMYISPITLARFEQDAGATNQSTVRLEGHAAFGVERQSAAVRIAGS